MKQPRACGACGTRNVGNTGHCAGCGSQLRSGQPGAPDLVGKGVGGHQLTKRLGHGSMGCVYAIDDPSSGLALKVLHPHISRDQLRVKRFQREARAALGLSHPSIVRLFEFGHDDTYGPFIVMERLHGKNLVERLAAAVLTPEQTVQVFEQVLSAVGHAHERGVIHRDLKAENVVVDESGGALVAKVCDFGMAKMLNEDGTAITAEGLVCGTPEYMSPEQARGEELDARADIYALGCLLFLVLTGRLPFRGTNAVDTMGQQLARRVPSARSSCPERKIPALLDEVARIAMAKSPSARYQSAGEMRDALLGMNAPDKKKQQGRWLALLLVALALSLGWAFVRP